jgi:hypothetical protein
MSAVLPTLPAPMTCPSWCSRPAGHGWEADALDNMGHYRMHPGPRLGEDVDAFSLQLAAAPGSQTFAIGFHQREPG